MLSTLTHGLGRSLKRKSKRERVVLGGRLKPCPAPDSPKAGYPSLGLEMANSGLAGCLILKILAPRVWLELARK